MVIPDFLYYSIFGAWWLIIMFWRSIKEKTGPLIYPIVVLMFGFIVVMKTEPDIKTEIAKPNDGFENIASPIVSFFEAFSSWSIVGYAALSLLVLVAIMMIPAGIDELKRKREKRKH
ncbi:hypothetical protein ACOZB2_03945 [Pantoea endophytica]|uniref:MFS transporter n=1 Tax=Pantoea sp. BJ2 TaxID=3141322 RepID=A0AAU7U4F7_9GAMM